LNVRHNADGISVGGNYVEDGEAAPFPSFIFNLFPKLGVWGLRVVQEVTNLMNNPHSLPGTAEWFYRQGGIV